LERLGAGHNFIAYCTHFVTRLWRTTLTAEIDRELILVPVILADASARQVAVRVGNGGGDMVSIAGDIGAGDRVVIRGAERLKDGQSVRVLSDRAVARQS
jgi:multidrug efflux pump subunit AcrA (membrane-fusion protein)